MHECVCGCGCECVCICAHVRLCVFVSVRVLSVFNLVVKVDMHECVCGCACECVCVYVCLCVFVTVLSLYLCVFITCVDCSLVIFNTLQIIFKFFNLLHNINSSTILIIRIILWFIPISLPCHYYSTLYSLYCTCNSTFTNRGSVLSSTDHNESIIVSEIGL